MNPAGAIWSAATPVHDTTAGFPSARPREKHGALERARKHGRNGACTARSFGGHHDQAENNPGSDRFQ